jgi:predicted HTH transcriptional regulator
MLIDIKMVEGIGTGIPRMISAMRGAGLPDPEFRQLGPLFKATLLNAFPNQVGNLNIRQRRSLIYLKDNTIVTAPQYRRMFKISHPIAVADLNKLIKLGLVKKRGRGPATAYVLAKPKVKQ